MSAIIDSFLTGNYRLFRATEDMESGDAVIEGENAEAVDHQALAVARFNNERAQMLLSFWGGNRMRQPDDMNLTSLQSQAIAHAERLRTLHEGRVQDRLVVELRSVVDNVLGGAPESPTEVLRDFQTHPLTEIELISEAYLRTLRAEPPTLNGSPVTSADERPPDPITNSSLQAAMLQLRVNADERLHRQAGISQSGIPRSPRHRLPLPDAPTFSPEVADEAHRRIIAAETLLREIGIDPAAELHATRLTDEPGEMVPIDPRPKGCPQCGGKLQCLSNDNTFCLDCDWDNLSTLSDDAVKNSPATLSFNHENVYVEFGMRLAVHNMRDEQIEIGFYEQRVHPAYCIRLRAGQSHQNPIPPPWSDRIQTVRVRNISHTIYEWHREERGV